MKKIVPVLLLFLILSSCGTKEDVVYFNGIGPKDNMIGIESYMPTYHVDDELLIVVNGTDPEAVKPFNLSAVSISLDRLDGYGRERLQTYIIDPEGNIDFPVIGKIKLAGLNREQAINLIESKLSPDYLKDPIVNIKTINYKVTVLGEVARPGTYTATNERITLIEALAMAGDLTIHGERENVLVIRDYDGEKTYTRVNLKSKDLFNSPVYYLTQNDVVYVEPNKSQARASKIGAGTSVAISIVGILISVATLVVTIVN